VKVLAKKRSQIVQEMLDATLNHFPTSLEGNTFSIEVAQTIETFFLCDHCSEIDDASKTFNFETPSRHYSKSDVDDDDASRGSTKSRGKGISNPIDDAVHTVGKFLKKTFDETPAKIKNMSKGAPVATASGTSTPVVPITRKTRKSVVGRQFDDDELKQVGEEANLLLDDERPQSELMVPSYSHPVPNFQSQGSKIGRMVENNPIIFAVIALAALIMLKRAAKLAVTVDLDALLLFMWAAFCVGLHTPRPMISGVDKYYGPPPSTPTGRKKTFTRQGEDRDGRKLLRMSMAVTPDSRAATSAINFEDEMEDEIMEINQSPLPRFPEGAELGTKFNCWSEPVSTNFHVRGPNYLKDKVKIESADFLFPVRGLDLFLTDTCPENAGRYVHRL
jgi:Protein ENHANCED DISEASE RESISTANCE 2, C-terminal